ncbi:MAG: EI24 domain-containing protein [Burkholderiales bacterium]
MPMLSAFARALRDLTHPRVLAVLFLPMLGAIALWTALAWFFWDAWIAALRGFMDATFAARWLSEHGASWVLSSARVVLVIALLLPAVLITAMVINELVAMPVIVSVVEREYPGLAKRSGGSVLGSLANAAVAVAVFALLWLGTLPLWLTGFGAFVLPAVNSAYLNQRLFRYDALAEHASRDEYRTLVKRGKGRLYLLGFLLAGLYYIPFVNLIAPVVSGLAFTHFCLGELAIQRRLSGHEWHPRLND